MNPEISTTFIPKKSFESSTNNQRSMYGAHESVLLPAIAGVALVITLAASLGMYAYNYYLLSSYGGLTKSLSQFKDKFNDEQLGTLLLLDKKIGAGQDVYKNHVAYSPFLIELGEITMPDVVYDSFSVEEARKKSNASENSIEFQLSGSATSYKVIAQQSRILGRNPYIKKHIFSGLKLGENDNINFTLSVTPNIDALRYAYEKPKSEVSGDDILKKDGKDNANGANGSMKSEPLPDISIETVNPGDEIVNGQIVPGQKLDNSSAGNNAEFDNTEGALKNTQNEPIKTNPNDNAIPNIVPDKKQVAPSNVKN